MAAPFSSRVTGIGSSQTATILELSSESNTPNEISESAENLKRRPQYFYDGVK